MSKNSEVTVDSIMDELQACGSPATVAIYRNHGAPENMYGCKVADLKKIAKKIKGNQTLALELYETGNSDAMYLAGIVADGQQMTRRQLQGWARKANWHMISEYTVPGVACQHPQAWQQGLQWIDAKQPHQAACGWATLAGVVATRPDAELELAAIDALLNRIATSVHAAPNRVRYAMNNFIIAVGSYVAPLLGAAQRTAKQIGKVEVEMGKTACKVPLAGAAIDKIVALDRVGKKRKTAKC
jgi:3-methyladenine DNA glycosylase AlkD